MVVDTKLCGSTGGLESLLAVRYKDSYLRVQSGGVLAKGINCLSKSTRKILRHSVIGLVLYISAICIFISESVAVLTE